MHRLTLFTSYCLSGNARMLMPSPTLQVGLETEGEIDMSGGQVILSVTNCRGNMTEFE